MKTVIEMARQAGICTWLKPPEDVIERIERFAKLVREEAIAEEREVCAKLVDDIEARCIGKDVDDPPLSHVAAAIRARGVSLDKERKMKTIQEMAVEAGAVYDVLAMGRHDGILFTPRELEAFAALVREEERERIAKWYESDGYMMFPVAIPKTIRSGK